MERKAPSGVPQGSDFIREQWVKNQLQLRVKEFTEDKPLNVFIGTWNVNAKKPSEDLSPWLLCEQEADIVVIGFQEIVELNAGNLVVDHNASKPWEERIEKTYRQPYVQICSKHLVGLALLVYVKKSLHPFVSDVQITTCGTGILGVAGNKGAVVARFNVYDSSVCFVNSHLAAHQKNSAGRNADYANICRRVHFADKSKPGKDLTIFDHNSLFWLGDLNYRLNISDLALVYQRIEIQDWGFLLKQDQLIIEKAAGNCFHRFHEGKIDFPPTYKFQPGTNLYERREGKKIRSPAWCDRIQWIGEDVQQHFYRRAELMCSDHKPVMALFTMQAKVLLPDKRKKVTDSLSRQLDAWENENIPKVAIEPMSFNFEGTRFNTPVTQKLRIRNIGQVIVQFHFAPKLQEQRYCKPWLRAEAEFGIIPPEEHLDVSLTVHVTRRTSQALTSGSDTLDDILVLRLENGIEFFITVNGDYVKSCLGSSLDLLVTTLGPVRTVSKLDPQPIKVLSVPKELWRVVDYLYRFGMEEANLFLTSGAAAELESIRECLDVGTEFGTFSSHSMAETLVRFLESLPEPVMSVQLLEAYTEGRHLTAFCKQVLAYLPPSHFNTFIYIIAFLREVLKHGPKNRLTADQLALIFSVCLMHTEGLDGAGTSSSSSSSSFLPTPAAPTTGSAASALASMHSRAAALREKAVAIMKHFLTSSDFV